MHCEILQSDLFDYFLNYVHELPSFFHNCKNRQIVNKTKCKLTTLELFVMRSILFSVNDASLICVCERQVGGV